MRYAVSAALSVFTLVAQEYRASLSGMVADGSGAPVPHASVVVANDATKVELITATNGAGRYSIGFLQPGRYSLTVEREGFKRFARNSIEAGASQRLWIDAILEVGPLTESVTVTDRVSPLQTESASRIQTVEQALIQRLPNNGRNPFLLTHALPGVTKTGYWGSAELYAYGQVSGVSIGGGRLRENESVIDGVTNTRPGRDVNFIPALDSLAEVSVITNIYDAQFSRTGGGVNVLVTKSGTNALHGALYEHLKHEKLNALGWANAKALAEYRAANPASPEPNRKFRNNTFGAEVDGPVYIPKLFDGRNRMFFMLSYEGLRQRNPSGTTVTLPSAAQAGGDFSDLVDNSGRRVGVYDATTTDASTGLRQLFPENRIPASRINPVAAKVTSFLPAPNTAGSGLARTGNYISTIPAKNGYNQWIGKLDYRVNSSHSIFFRRGATPWENFDAVVWGTNAAEPSVQAPSSRRALNYAADWTAVVRPDLVFNLRGGLARTENFSGNIFGVGYDPRDLGFSPALVSQFDFLQFPRFELPGYTSIGTGRSVTDASDSWSLQPNASWLRGRHVLKIGSELRRYNQNNLGPGYGSGNYSFGRNWTQQNARQADAFSGHEFATFLLGYPSSGFVEKNINRAFRWHYYSGYVQDDWKVTPRLALNLGFRWDYEAPAAERFNRVVTDFAFGQPSPVAAQVAGRSLQGGPIYAGTSGNARQAFERDRNNVQPRIGLAFRIGDKLLFRGGYGISYLGQSALPPSTGYSRTTPVVATLDSLTPRVDLRNAFPDGVQRPVGRSEGLAANLGQAIQFPYRERGLPYSQQFSAGFQYDLPWSLRADISYVGNLTRALPVDVEYNSLPTGELNKAAAYYTERVTNPMAGLLPLNASKNGAAIARMDLLLPYPQYTSVQALSVPIGRQRYDAMQSSLARRFASGLAFAAHLTISKTLERANLLNAQDFDRANPGASKLEKRLVDYDAPVHLGIAGSYDLPFGRGRRWAAGRHPALNAVLGGWTLALNYNRRSGPPLDFPNAAPLEARSARLSWDQRAAMARSLGKEDWDLSYMPYFDTGLFPRTAPLATDYRTYPTRFPDVRGLGLNNLDLSVAKGFAIREGVRFECRAELMNAMNTTYFRRLIAGGNNVTDPRFGFLTQDPTVDGRIVVLVARLSF
jgi:Carboxypeptidase regulatory-like domain/TonB dependent receptor